MPMKRKSGSGGERELLGMFVAFISLMVGYFLAEASLARFVHPLHRVSAAVVALLGYVVTLFIYFQLQKSRKP